MTDFIYTKALGYEFDNQFAKLIKYSKIIFQNGNISLGKENLERLDKFYNPYEKTKATHFENCTKFYMETFYSFYNENKSFFKTDISLATRKSWLVNEDIQVTIKGDKSTKVLALSTIYRTALHISEISKSVDNNDETTIYPLIVLLHLFRILKLVVPLNDKEEKDVIQSDIKQISSELGLDKDATTSQPKPKQMNFADIFSSQNMGMIETAIKAITSNDKFNSVMQNISSKDGPDNGQLNPSELTTGVLEIMNAMKSEIPGILSTINPNMNQNANE